MSFANLSLTARLMLCFVGASTALAVTTGVVLYLALASGLQWRDDQVLQKRMLTVRDLLQARNLDPELVDHEVSEDLEGPRQLFMRVVAPPHIGVHETPLMPAFLVPERFPDVATAAAGAMRLATLIDADGREFRVLSARVPVPVPEMSGPAWATIQMAADTSLDSEVLNWYARLAAMIVVGIMLMSAAGGSLLVRAQMRPLKRFAAETAKIESSKLDYRLALAGLPAELVELGEQFNQMLARLDTAYASLRSYADDIAHELRTPLTRMQLSAELALRQAGTPDDYRAALEATCEECHELTRLVSSLLFLARAENGQAVLTRENVNIARKLEKVRSFFESSAADGGIKLSVICDEGLVANVDRALFQRAISNIVANALEHTPRGGSVTVRAEKRGEDLTITIADTGHGIPEEQRPFVFDRYFRGPHSRMTDDERVGIGLAITKCIVDLHGGTITVSGERNEGARFELLLPAG